MLTRTPAADKQRVAVDEETVRKFVSLIHEQAARALNGIERPGVLQLTRLHPLDKKLVPTRFRIDDVDGMTKQAIADAKAGHNAYVEARTVAEGTPPHKRGDINDTGFVFALVVDSDADKGQATNRDLSRLASLVIETSPGNRHYWFFLNQAVRAGDAQPVGEAMRQALGTDSDTGTVTQPYRVAGTPNYPGKAKRKRGRTTVERTFIIDAQPDRSWTLDELRLQFSGPKQKSGGGNGTRSLRPTTNERTKGGNATRILRPTTVRSSSIRMLRTTVQTAAGFFSLPFGERSSRGSMTQLSWGRSSIQRMLATQFTSTVVITEKPTKKRVRIWRDKLREPERR